MTHLPLQRIEMGMTIAQAIILGIIQGTFMFFPVSSTAHMVLANHLMGNDSSTITKADTPEMILFYLVVHVGTVFSIIFVFRKSLQHLCGGILRDANKLRHNPAKIIKLNQHLPVKLALLGLFAVFVTGLIGFPFKRTFETIFASPAAIAITLTITGLLLWWTDHIRGRFRLRQLSLRHAGIIGIGQALALMPGLSRSGLTISFALFTGIRRRWAAEFSFFIAIPTILGGALLQGIEVYKLGGIQHISLTAYAVAFAVSAIVGIIALKLVIHLLYRARFRYFSYYVWTLAAIVTTLIFTGHLDATTTR